MCIDVLYQFLRLSLLEPCGMGSCEWRPTDATGSASCTWNPNLPEAYPRRHGFQQHQRHPESSQSTLRDSRFTPWCVDISQRCPSKRRTEYLSAELSDHAIDVTVVHANGLLEYDVHNVRALEYLNL